MCDDSELVNHTFSVAPDPLSFISWVEPPLQASVVSRDSCRTRILVALQSLNTPQCEHETAGRSNKIGTGANRPRGFGRCDQFTAGDDLGAITKPLLFELIDDQR